MPITPFVDSPAVRAMARRVVNYASARENWFRVRADGTSDPPVPGDVPAHVCCLPINYRCVFSVTVINDVPYRHFSVSIPGTNRLPNMVVLETLLEMFGFTDAPLASDIDHDVPCVVMLQPL